MDEHETIYPYSNDDDTPDSRFFFSIRPLVTGRISKRAQQAAFTRDGKDDPSTKGKAPVPDEARFTAALWREMIPDARLPDVTRPGEYLPWPVTADQLDDLPVFLVAQIQAAIDARNGADLRAWGTEVGAQAADAFRPAGPDRAGDVPAPVPSADAGAGE